jgi:choline dehydrogenase-like flavoprotein
MKMPEDLHRLRPITDLVTDLCIIGAGPAGLAIARAFAGTSVQVLLVESGRTTEDRRIDALGEIESDNATRELDPTRVRNRIFGGSTHTWKGRCTAFSDIDFAKRDWVPHSGWPFGASEVGPFLHRAAEFMALGPHTYDERLFARIGARPPEPEVDRRALEVRFWQFCTTRELALVSKPRRFGPEFLKTPPDNVRILVNATATQLCTDPDGSRLLGVEVCSIEGTKATVRSRATVLCAGGIENARLLLASNRVQSHGVGNAHGNVGRYLMDHLRIEVGDFALEHAEVLQDRFDFYTVRTEHGPRSYIQGFALSPALQRAEKLLHCAAWVEQSRARDDPWSVARSLLRHGNHARRESLGVVLRQARFIGSGLVRSVSTRRGIRHKADRITLMCMCEQIPDPDSRLVLSSRTDALGMPLTRVHWKVCERELETLARTGEIVAEAFERASLPLVRLFDWVRQRRFDQAAIIDVAHPTGTTRMSTQPHDGVVDENCRVHGVEGLYIAGSSVFPTTGHANPTLMLTALAFRLADHLRASLFAGVPGGIPTGSADLD